MNDSHTDRSTQGEGEDHTSVKDDSAASAGSESPEEGKAAMEAAEDAVIDSDDD